jgi:alkylated DNA repair dioxygenase AlkB
MLQPSIPGLLARGLPEGFSYAPRLLSTAEHDALLAHVARIPYAELRMRGVTARRRVAHFGWKYDYATRRAQAGAGGASALPEFLLSLRARCGELAGEAPDRFEEALATFYPPGASIGWHRDAPQFGIVVGVSFGSPCRMRFRRALLGRQVTSETLLEPGSAYVLSGAARWAWQHHIPPLTAPRWSITLRTLRQLSPGE